MQCYILYIFIHAEQKRRAIEAAMGAEAKAVIHKNAPYSHPRSATMEPYATRVLIIKNLWFAFNLLGVFSPSFLLLNFQMP